MSESFQGEDLSSNEVELANGLIDKWICNVPFLHGIGLLKKILDVDFKGFGEFIDVA